MRIIEVKERTEMIVNQLLEVWEDSVKATHLFLSNEEIKNIKKNVPQAISGVSHLVIIENESYQPIAFMGIEDTKLEMLFIKNSERGKGLRKQFYVENENYKMIGKSVTDTSWFDEIDTTNQNILIVAEGLTMYLSEQELKNLLEGLNAKFGNATIVFDAYSRQAVKSSKLKNPVNQMNASIKWGMNDPSDFTKLNEHLEFVREYLIRKKENNLKGITKFIFENLYCGKISESLYKIYEFRLKDKEEIER